MLNLRYSTTSPFVRKVSVTIIECGLEDHVINKPTNPWAPDTDLPQDNPLGKVPALTIEDGQVLFDSPVICEYLDSLGTTPRLFPQQGQARWTALRLQALGDGIMEAAVARLLESRRPREEQSAAFAERYKSAVHRAVDELDHSVDQLMGDFTIGSLSSACALEYLDFRFSQDDWRAGRPKLVEWYESVAKRPSLRQTVPHE